jgi:hypothetical protein
MNYLASGDENQSASGCFWPKAAAGLVIHSAAGIDPKRTFGSTTLKRELHMCCAAAFGQSQTFGLGVILNQYG